MTESKICTCPSGNGSLRHPCPAHPASVEQAGGDERVKCAVCVDSGKVYDISGEGPWKCYACTGSHEVVGYANGDELDNMLDDRTAVLSPVKTSFHTVPVYREARAALAQPSPASDLDPFNLAPHAEAFNEAPAEALKSDQAEAERPEADPHIPAQTIAEAAIEQLIKSGAEHYEEFHFDVHIDGHEGERPVVVTVAFSDGPSAHELRMKAEQQRDSALAEVERLTRDRDDCLKARLHYATQLGEALARVAELENQDPVAHLRASDLERLNQPGIAGSAGSLWNGPREGFVPLYAAPVAQAQHSVPGDIMRDAQRYRWLRDQQFYFSFSTENSDAGISSCTAGMSSRFKNLSWVDAAIDSAIAAAPGKEVGHE
ncbi:hypothetical protein [Pseudomonas aeruginosa]|uniref:hypothetical protein n=1 Tax=Pseudomonas aeruginosa TaxID=287 RepID=UPI0018F453EC|nr:hypothetical protein [Pseudomonas aeruginosa]